MDWSAGQSRHQEIETARNAVDFRPNERALLWPPAQKLRRLHNGTRRPLLA